MRQFTSEERIRRVWDKEEAKAVLCRHAYLEAANRRAESLSQLWVAEPEHQATASYGKNWGFPVSPMAFLVRNQCQIRRRSHSSR